MNLLDYEYVKNAAKILDCASRQNFLTHTPAIIRTAKYQNKAEELETLRNATATKDKTSQRSKRTINRQT